MQNIPEAIEVKGARVHNLKSVDVRVPLHEIVGIAGVSGSGAGAWGTSRPKPSSPLLLKSNPKAKVFPFRMSGIVAINLCGLASASRVDADAAPKRHAGKRKSRNQKERSKNLEPKKTRREKPKAKDQNQPKAPPHTAKREYPKQKHQNRKQIQPSKNDNQIFPAKENSNQQDRQPIHHNPTFASPEVADREKRGPQTGFSRLRAHRRTA